MWQAIVANTVVLCCHFVFNLKLPTRDRLSWNRLAWPADNTPEYHLSAGEAGSAVIIVLTLRAAEEPSLTLSGEVHANDGGRGRAARGWVLQGARAAVEAVGAAQASAVRLVAELIRWAAVVVTAERTTGAIHASEARSRGGGAEGHRTITVVSTAGLADVRVDVAYGVR
jgi:hypothetical protein